MATEIEQLLIGFLQTSKASKGAAALAYLQIKEESKMLEMCTFLSENPEATEEEILKMAKQLSGTKA